MTIIVDNGAAFTAAATIYAFLKENKKPPEKTVVADIGASGMIGGGVVRGLEGKVQKIIAIAREIRKISNLSNIAEICTNENLAIISQADVVILNTSSPIPIINKNNCEWLKENAIVLDVAVPSDFDDAVLQIRPDIKLIRCGLIRLPGDPKTKIDFHFGEGLVPACLSQAVILGLTKEYSNATRGAMIRPKTMDWYLEQADLFGFEIITSDIAERRLFSGQGGKQ